MVETTALGAAGLAGLAAGVWKDADEFLATRQFTTFTPQMSRGDADGAAHAGWQRAVRADDRVGARPSARFMSVATAIASRSALPSARRVPDVRPSRRESCRSCRCAVSPEVMLVGQAPGKVEAEGGKPFAGRAGKTLFRWLERAGIDEATARRSHLHRRDHALLSGAEPERPRRSRSVADGAGGVRRLARRGAARSFGRSCSFPSDGWRSRGFFRTFRSTSSSVARTTSSTSAAVARDSAAASVGREQLDSQGDHPRLLERALALIGRELRRLGDRRTIERSVA